MNGGDENITMEEEVDVIPVTSVIATAAASLLALVIISGNLLVITAFFRDKKLQSIANGFLVSLACADFLVGAVIIPIRIGLLFNNFEALILNGPFCYVISTVEIWTCTSSLLHLCVISVDRYIAIVHPMTYPVRMSRKMSLVIISALWCLSLGVSISLVIYQRVASGSDGCLRFVSSFVEVVTALAVFFVPATIMGVLYAKIFLAVRAHIGRVQRGRMALSGDTAQDAMRIHRGSAAVGIGTTSKYKAVKTIGIVIGALLLCWLPVNIVLLISPWCPQTCIQWYQFVWLGYVNSAINPFIYAFTNPSFKMAFMKILHCKRNSNSRRSDGNHGKSHTDGTLEMNSAHFPCAYPLQHQYF